MIKFFITTSVALMVGLWSTQGIAQTIEIMRLADKNSPRLQALSLNPNGDIWASGVAGQVLVSHDNGQSWQQKSVIGANTLQFRDIWASGNTVYLLAAGEGVDSRLYKSIDNGQVWQQQYVMDNPKGFINCFDFWDQNNGLVVGDSIDDQVFMLTTNDGGKHWIRVLNAPPINEGGEGAFSASGSCVRTLGSQQAWISTGATKQARLLRTKNRAKTWTSTPLPFPNSDTAGIFSAIPSSGFAFGGQMKPAIITGYRRDQNHWQAINNIPLNGAIYGSDSYDNNVIVANPDGVAWSKDNGKTWQRIVSDPYWVVEINDNGDAWLAGPQGRISRIRLAK